MLFEKLRNKLVGRVEPTPPGPEAIHAHVLGELHPPREPPFSPAPATAAMPRGRYGAEFEGERPVAPSEIEALKPPSVEEFPRPPERPPEPPREFEKRFEERGMYELIDRLAVIEAQLATIRAQTETLNERMKTIELYIRSRMPRTTF
ncbi:MAG: hypothetical protein QW548_00240 [Candidatus Aenigmatarchaeota archaeon]